MHLTVSARGHDPGAILAPFQDGDARIAASLELHEVPPSEECRALRPAVEKVSLKGIHCLALSHAFDALVQRPFDRALEDPPRTHVAVERMESVPTSVGEISAPALAGTADASAIVPQALRRRGRPMDRRGPPRGTVGAERSPRSECRTPRYLSAAHAASKPRVASVRRPGCTRHCRSKRPAPRCGTTPGVSLACGDL
jgi:hypothetical protein